MDERFIVEAHRIMNSTLQLMTDEQKEKVAEMSLGARIQWIQSILNEAYPGMFSYHKIARRAKSLSPQALWRIAVGETESPGVTVLPGLANALGVSVEFLVTGTTDEKPETPQGVIDWSLALPERFAEFISEPGSRQYVVAALEIAAMAKRNNVSPETLLQVVSGLVDLEKTVRAEALGKTPGPSKSGPSKSGEVSK